MAYERDGRNDPRADDNRWDRDEYGTSGARDYRAAGELGGYDRDRQRDRGQQAYGQRDRGRQDYGSRDYGSSGDAQNERSNRGGWDDRQGFTGGDRDRDRQPQGQGQGQYGRDTYRQSRGTFDRQPQNYREQHRDNDRGFFDRAGDEVRSWFGDEDAERRRERDARDTERGGSFGRDEHYSSWRNQQLAAFDRDYDEYRQENRDKFHNEFASFRTERQSQRDLLNKVEEHQEVLGSDGAHVGTVDKVRGDRIILTKSDPDAGDRHHSIPSRWLQAADGGKLTLRKTADEAKQHWREEERQGGGGGLFGGDRDRQQSNEAGRANENGESTGGTNLNRSFSGTY